MTDQRPLSPRRRVRTALPSFEAACRGIFPLNPWFDRLQFSFRGAATVRLPRPEALGAYLTDVAGEEGRYFSVGRPGARSLRIEFKSSHWLFAAKLNLRLEAGRWSGPGTINLNATRLFAGMSASREPEDEFSIEDTDLIRNLVDFDAGHVTLDGGDNFVLDRFVPRAIHVNWPLYVSRYLDAVRRAVITALGPARDFTRRQQTDWLLYIPPPERWSLKQAEAYCEVRDPNALLRVNEISQHASSLANRFAERLYPGTNVIAASQRRSNMPLLSFDLNAENTSLAIYAKAHERLRIEVRYSKSPLRTCRLRKSEYEMPGGVSQLLQAVSSNAHSRLVAFFKACQGQFQPQVPTMAVMASLLALAATACDNDAVLLAQVLAILIDRGGLGALGHRAMPQVVENLCRSGVVAPTRAGLRRQREDYILRPEYASVIRLLRPLADQPETH